MAKLPATTEKARPIDLFKKQIELAAPTLMHMVPKDVPFERFRAEIVTAVAYSPELLECSTESLIRETAQAAGLGLSLNKSLKEGDILVVWNSKAQRKEAQFRPRYGGLMKLARKSGEIRDIYAHEVYANDFFDYDLGLNKRLDHKPAKGERGELTGQAYVVWETKDGVKGFEVVEAERMYRIRDRSEGYKAFKAGKIKSTPWDSDKAQMMRKTAVRAGTTYMPISSQAFHEALHKDVERDFEAADVELHGDYMDVTDATPAAPSEAAKKQTTSLEDRITGTQAAVTRIEPPQELDGQDWGAWEKLMLAAAKAATVPERAAIFAAHEDLIEAAPDAVVVKVGAALGISP